jgi:hypothetical protein
VKTRTIVSILLVAASHLLLTVYSLLASLYFTIPGEPGFDSTAAQRAAFFGALVQVLAFPILPLLTDLLPLSLSDGLLGWLWFALNSLLWALAIILAWRILRRLLIPQGSHLPDAA